MATRKRTGGDDSAWSQPGLGGDPQSSRAGQKTAGVVGRIGEEFWHAMDLVPLSVSRWGSRPKMNANIKWLLDQGYDEETIKASFSFFRSDVSTIAIPTGDSCWDVYFRRRGSYLRSVARAREGMRPGGQIVHKAGDIRGDNPRSQAGRPERPDDDDE